MFLHDAVIEGLTEGKSVVTAAEFPEYYSHLKRLNPSTQKSEIWEQFQVTNLFMNLTVGNKNFENRTRILTV